MSISSYDNLLKQVESLKMENSHLRRELQDNSSHLTTLENEASSMKTVLTHLQTAMVEDLDSSNYQEPGKTPGGDSETEGGAGDDSITDDNAGTVLPPDDDLDQNSNSNSNVSTEDDPATGQNWMLVETDNGPRSHSEPVLGQHPQHMMREDNQMCSTSASTQQLKSQSHSPTSGSPSKKRSTKRGGEWSAYSVIQELDQERNGLVAEIEEEDKHRKWYYEQLEGLQYQLENLPVSDTYNLQADMTRRQVEYEVQRLQDMMHETMGSAEQIAHRHEARLQRIHTIETEMVGLQQRHRDNMELEHGKRDSGTCDHLERDQGDVVVTDASTNTTVSSEAFVSRLYQADDSQIQSDEGILTSGPNGTDLVTIATQTSEVYLPESPAPHEGSRRHSNQNLAALYHGGWPLEGGGSPSDASLTALVNQDTASVMSFNSSSASSASHGRGGGGGGNGNGGVAQQLGTKVEMVYSLLSMLGTHDKDDMSRTLLAMSSSQDSCIAMRQSGCLPLLIQLLHGSDKDSGLLGNTRGSKSARARAAAALHNIVHSHPDDKRGRREARVLRLLEQIRAHCDQLRDSSEEEDDDSGEEKKSLLGSRAADIDHHPGPAIAALMKLSFDEEHRHAICTLGGLQAIAELLQVDHDINGNTMEQYNITMRRYACMALTNLTFGDGTNKALLCSMKTAMRALVSQLQSPNEDLRQVAASVLRNLSWRADLASKKTLREVGSVTALMCAAMEVKKESTLKSILSALWNLSAHCSENKADICSVDGSLAFLVSTLTYKSPSKTLAIIENGGGILRNISSHIAVREDYRKVLRQQQCLQMLLKHLKSPSLTIVSNACGTLWNLSARCQEDQQALWEMGAVSMLRNLVNSKHKMISMGSAAALKNLLSARPALANLESDRYKPNKPGLHVRKQRALEAEIDQNLAETCDNMESPQSSPTESRKHDPRNRAKYSYTDGSGVHTVVTDTDPRRCLLRGSYLTRAYGGDSPPSEDRVHSPQRGVSRSGSQDSVGSAHSDISHDRNRTHHMLAKSNKLLQERQTIFDRRRDPSIERVRTSATSSRIMQVMQEVALHAGLESGPVNLKDPFSLRESQSADTTPPTPRRGQIPVRSSVPTYNHTNGAATQKAGRQPSELMSHSTEGNYSQLGQRLENLQLSVTDPEPEQDRPINYSMKYSEAPAAKQSATKPPVNHSQQASAFVKPAPRVAAALPYETQAQAKVNTVPAHSKKLHGSRSSSQDSNTSANYPGYVHGEATDSMDLPTNFSIRFAELDDESPSADEPINYSKHYNEDDVDNVLCSIHDDTVKTFCTEGTPLNFSTATSMNDLTVKAAVQAQARPTTDLEVSDETRDFAARYTESEHLSGTGTQSTGRNTSSTVVQKPATSYQEKASGATDSKPTASNDTSEAPSLYSYNDSTSTSSPSEKPTRYCTEGTPTCFSRVSSLSSLHSPDSHSTHSKDDGLESINENDSLETSQNVTLKAPPHDDSFQSANTSASHGESTGSGAGKSVTFDSNVQETPLMFSRCSSLGSLSSFDAHSVHSSVVSDYSRRASEVVSPSELPDSPSDTMPPSPSHCKSPVRFAPDDDTKVKQLAKPGMPQNPDVQTPEHQKAQKILDELPKSYADEGSPAGGFSSATSLSALTFDDEPRIQKEPELRRVPLGQEDGNDTTLSGLDITVIEKEQEEKMPQSGQTSFLDDDDDNSSVSEGEENLLAECISWAMPTKSQKKIKRSTSDTQIKKQAGSSTRSNQAIVKPTARIPSSQSAGLLSAASPLMQAMTPSYHAPNPVLPHTQEEGMVSGYDTPKNFNTEDTPLNYSASGSLSDLSMDWHTGDGAETNQSQKVDAGDLSSLSDDDFDDEGLLSEAIQLAMPKKVQKKPKIPDRTAEGSDCRDRLPYHQSPAYRPVQVQQPPVKPVQQAQSLQYNMARDQHDVDGASEGHDSDCVKTYAVEGTPLNFSRATSLSDLTNIDDLMKEEQTPGESAEQSPAMDRTQINLAALADEAELAGSTQDSPRVFDVEGTPMSFSRNDSLSPLPCEDDGQKGGQHTPKHSKTPNSGNSPRTKLFGSRKAGIQSPAIMRLKTPGKHHQHLLCEPSSHSTPIGKGELPSPKPGEDGVTGYAMEGTPMCFSQNSSLSSLDSDEHESMANRSGGSGGSGGSTGAATSRDQSRTFKVEDTPANISGESSLSSLSVESLSFEPTAAETALLEECINLGMPKSSHKKKKKDTKPVRTTPEVVLRKKSPKSEMPARIDNHPGGRDAEGNISTTKPKNEDRPQAELAKAKERSSLVKNSSEQDEAETMLLKDQKEACNQEMLQAKGQALAAAAAQVDAACASAVAADPLTFSLTGSLEIDENKLAEEAEQLSNKFAELSMEASDEYDEKDLCLEADKTDDESEEKSKEDAAIGEKSTTTKGPTCQLFKGKTESSESLNLGCRALEQSGTDSDFNDIMKETLPEMSSSLVSNVTLTSLEEDSLSEAGEEEEDSPNATILQRENTVVEVFSQHLAPQHEENEEEEGEEEEVDGSLNSTLEGAQDFSLEMERALEENANLILSELSMTRAFSNGTLDDELFIDDETLSLVSNDYTSDTASEVSASLSLSSHTASEHASEVSSSTLSHTSSATTTVQPRGPRIGKPRIVSQPQVRDDGPKGIRGGRKRALPASVRAAQASTVKSTTPPKTTGTPNAIRGGGGQRKTTPTAVQQKCQWNASAPVNPKLIGTQKKTPPKTPPRGPVKGAVTAKPATPVRTTKPTSNGGQKSSPSGVQKPSPNGVQKPSPNGGQKPSPSGLQKPSPSGVQKPSPSGVQKSSLASTVPKSSPSSKFGAQRPTTASSPKSSPKPIRSTKIGGVSQAVVNKSPGRPGTSIPRSGLVRPSGSSPRSSQDKPVAKQETKRSPVSEQQTSKRPATAATTVAVAATAGAKDLDRPAPPIKQGTFTMDSPTQNAPQILHECTDLNGNKNSSSTSAEEAVKVVAVKLPTPSKLKPPQRQSPPNNLSKTLVGTSQQETLKHSGNPAGALASKRESQLKKSNSSSGSNNSLSRAAARGSDTSLNKTGSSSSLKSLGSQRTPPKVTPRGASSIKKSDSQSSLKKPASRSSTPTVARSSPTGSTSSIPSAKGVSPPRRSLPTPVGKKAAVSKIAGLWRKDKKVEPAEQATTKTNASGPANKTPKSPKSNRKNSVPKNDNKLVKKSTETEERTGSKDSLRRSSTYDKISAESGSISSGGDTVSLGKTSPQEEKKAPPVPPRSLWRRTYTVEQEEQNRMLSKVDIPIDEPKTDCASGGAGAAEDSVVTTADTPQQDASARKDTKTHKKRFSWWRKDSDGSKGEKKVKGASKIPSPGSKKSPKGGVWVTIDGAISLEDPVTSASKTLQANGSASQHQKSVTLKSPVSAISEHNILQVRERVQQGSMAQKPKELAIDPARLGPSPVTSPTRGLTPANAAIVPPFNYNPSQKSSPGTQQEDDSTSPVKTMTKTEMLIARRRQSYLNSLKITDDGSEGGDTKKTSCLVTTV